MTHFPTIFFYWKFYKTSASTVPTRGNWPSLWHRCIIYGFIPLILLSVCEKVTWFYKFRYRYRQWNHDIIWKWEKKVKVLVVTQSCLTLCDPMCNPMDCSSPGSSVLGILQARILEWVAISFSKVSSQPRCRTWAPQADSSPSEPPGKPSYGNTHTEINDHLGLKFHILEFETFRAALFTVDKKWSNPKCSLMDKCINIWNMQKKKRNIIQALKERKFWHMDKLWGHYAGWKNLATEG